jgi:hypothetical protein
MWLAIVMQETVSAGLVINQYLALSNVTIWKYNPNPMQPIMPVENPYVLNIMLKDKW